MPIVIGKANLRFSKSQFDIMENNKLFITNLILVDQNGYKKGVYSENNSKYIFQKH
jgi:hypothetical protein